MFTSDPDDPAQRRLFTRRALVLGGLHVAGLSVVAGRLWNLQVVEHGRYDLLAEENRVNLQVLAPERGRIVDRFGVVLASNVESYRATLVPSLARDVRVVLTRFARIVPLETASIERIVQRARRQQPSIPIIVAQDLSFEQIAAIGLHAPALPGVGTEAAPLRRYRQGAALGHVVGYVGAVERAAMDDDPVLRLPGMRIGKLGLERLADVRLRGTGGLVQSEVDSRGHIVRHVDRVEPVGGEEIVSTIDVALQKEVAAQLAPFRRAAAVVLDVDEGDILALASHPTFDPNDVLDRTRPLGFERLRSMLDDPMNNRATRGQYPPGSTFKMVVALAALEAGVIDLKEKIGCDGRFDYFDQTFRCWKRSGHGACDLHRGLVESCDCYFYEAARRTGIDAIAAMARRFGLGQRFDNVVPGQKIGVVPDPDWKRGRFGRGWLGGETILAGIGQGYVLATPLQLTVMTARLATGRAVVPRLVRLPAAGSTTVAAPVVPGRPEWHAAIRRAMIAVVQDDNGTGGRARAKNGNFQVAGKTGTSQVSRFSSETAQLDLRWELRDHALFVSYAPADKPRYAVATVIEHGGGGGAVAAPVAREIMDTVMARDPVARPVWRQSASDGAPRARGG